MLKLRAGLELGVGCTILGNCELHLGALFVCHKGKMEDVQNCESHLASGLTTTLNYSLYTSKSEGCSSDD